MKSVLAVVAASILLLSACTAADPTDPSAAPEPAENFCDAMAAAAEAAPPAVEAIDALFTTIDAMSVGGGATDLDELQAAGADTVSTAMAYATALNNAAALAPAGTAPDLEDLSSYWTLYVAGLGQIAETATSYGSMIDQNSALEANADAARLVEEQPGAQKRVNESYLAECTSA